MKLFLIAVLLTPVVLSYPYREEDDDTYGKGQRLWKKMMDKVVARMQENSENNDLMLDGAPLSIQGGTHKGKQWLGPDGTFPNDDDLVLTDPWAIEKWGYPSQGEMETPPETESSVNMEELEEMSPEEEEEQEKEEEQQIADDAKHYNMYPVPVNPCPEGYTSKDGCEENVPDSAEFSKQFQQSQVGKEDPEHNFNDKFYKEGEKIESLVAKKAPIIRKKRGAYGK